MTQISSDNTAQMSPKLNHFTLIMKKKFKIPQKWYKEFGEHIWTREFQGFIFLNSESRFESLQFIDIIDNTDMQSSFLSSTKSVQELCFNKISTEDANEIVKLWNIWIQTRIQSFCNNIVQE